MLAGVFSYVAGILLFSDLEAVSDVVADISSTISEQDLLSDSYEDAALRGIEFCPQCHNLVRVETRSANGFGECPVCYSMTSDATKLLMV